MIGRRIDIVDAEHLLIKTRWQGNDDVGSGRMEVMQASPDKVSLRLDFITPFESRNTTEFSLVPKDGGTEVRWLMFGPAPTPLCPCPRRFTPAAAGSWAAPPSSRP